METKIESKYCACDNPEWEKDDNNYRFCLMCGKESEGNYYDYSPSEEALDDYDPETNSIVL